MSRVLQCTKVCEYYTGVLCSGGSRERALLAPSASVAITLSSSGLRRLAAKVMAAAAGGCHGAAVGEDGALFVWGSGEDGQLGTGDTASRLAPTRVAGLTAPVRQVAAGDKHTGIVTEAGDLLMFGLGVDGRLGLGRRGRSDDADAGGAGGV